MNEKTAERTKLHNTVILVETVACLGAVVESLSQGWEFWVPPLILGGLIASWWMHVTQYRQPLYRENFYIVFSMLVMLFHGVHRTSFFDVFVIYAIVLGSIALLRRPGFIRLLLAEFFLLMTVQILWDVKEGGAVFSI